MELRRIPLSRYATFVAGAEDRSIFHTWDWLESIVGALAVAVEPLGLVHGEELLGVLPVLSRRVGPLRVRGWPLPGCATPPVPPLIPEHLGQELVRAVSGWVRSNRVAHFQMCWPHELLALPRGTWTETGQSLEVSIGPSLDEMWQRLRPPARRRVRHALRAGVRPHWVQNELFVRDYERLLESTYVRRQGIRPNYPSRLHRELLRRRDHLGLRVLAASRDGQLHAALWLLPSGSRCYFWDGAMDQAERATSASNLLHWEALRWCHQRGVAAYDLGGVTGRGGARPGIARFKESLGASTRSHVTVYWQRPGLALALRIYRAWLRRRDRPRRDGP